MKNYLSQEYKCKNCGRPIPFTTDEVIHCEYCDSEFVIPIPKKQQLLSNAETNLTYFKDYSAAHKDFTSITKEYASDYKGWWGLVRCDTHNFEYFPLIGFITDIIIRNAKRTLLLKIHPQETKNEIQSAWGEYIKNYRSFIEDQQNVIEEKTKNTKSTLYSEQNKNQDDIKSLEEKLKKIKDDIKCYEKKKEEIQDKIKDIEKKIKYKTEAQESGGRLLFMVILLIAGVLLLAFGIKEYPPLIGWGIGSWSLFAIILALSKLNMSRIKKQSVKYNELLTNCKKELETSNHNEREANNSIRKLYSRQKEIIDELLIVDENEQKEKEILINIKTILDDAI